MTLTEFVLARIAAREAVAQAATPGPWEDTGTVLAGVVKGYDTVATCNSSEWGGGEYTYPASAEEAANAAHIALNGPAAVLADCEAQRWVVQEAARAEAPGSCYGWEEGYAEGEWDMAQAVLRLMALRHADHPDYDESWRP